MEKITSKTNNCIKQAAKLSASGAARRKSGQFLLEGVRLCCDALNSKMRPLTVLVTESCLGKHEAVLSPLVTACKQSYFITEDIACKLADTVHPQGVFCICETALIQMQPRPGGKYIVLDHVQDPSNLGAVIRTAEALGLDGAVVGGGVDLYNPKALRASMGSLLRFPVLAVASIPDMLVVLKQMGIRVLATVPDQNALSITSIPMTGGLAAVIGNEANGVSPAVMQAATDVVSIPMPGRAESLNAATAATITIWEMMRGNASDS